MPASPATRSSDVSKACLLGVGRQPVQRCVDATAVYEFLQLRDSFIARTFEVGEAKAVAAVCLVEFLRAAPRIPQQGHSGKRRGVLVTVDAIGARVGATSLGELDARPRN